MSPRASLSHLHHTMMIRSAILLSALMIAQISADGGCCSPCADCQLEVDILQNHNNIYAPLTVGSGFFDYTADVNGQASSTGADGWFNSTTAAPYSIKSNEVYALLAGCNEFIAEAVLTFSSQVIQGTIESPLGINQDPMYGAGFFGIVDATGEWTFDFVLTNARVFARLAFQRVGVPSPTDSARSFTYLIPVACRRPKDINQYRIILNPAQQSVWWQVDSKDVLKVCHPGRPAPSQAFLVAESGNTLQNGFPSAVKIALGLMVQGRGWPNAACQQTIFDQQEQNLYTYPGCACEYAQYQDPSSYLIEMKLRYFELQVMQAYCGKECPGGCCPGCNADPNPCHRPLPEPSESSSSVHYQRRRKLSSSSSSLCNPVRTPSQSRHGQCNVNDYEDLRRRQLQMTPLHISSGSASYFDSSSSTSSSEGIRHHGPVGPSAWFGNHAREARRRFKKPGKPYGTLVAHDWIW